MSLLAINCNKEEPALEKLEAKVPNFSATVVTSEEISEITSSINKRIESKCNLITVKDREKTFWVDKESAMVFVILLVTLHSLLECMFKTAV